MLNVALLYGGASGEHDVSLMSAATVAAALSTHKYNIIPIFITREGRWLLNDSGFGVVATPLLERISAPCFITQELGLVRMTSGGRVRPIPVDIVFPVLHGRMGEDGSVQGLCELAGIPYVGAGIAASAASMDKAFAKAVSKQLEIPFPQYITHHSFDTLTEPVPLTYPLFVKPANCGSSVGITKVWDQQDLQEAIEYALSYDTKVLIEEGIDGRELECALIGDGSADTILSGVGEIIPADEFYSYNAKYNNPSSRTVIPANIPPHIEEAVRDYSLKIFRGLGISGMARVDFFYNEKTDTVYFNEVNTIPGWTPISMYPMLLNLAGLSNSDIVDKLIELALA